MSERTIGFDVAGLAESDSQAPPPADAALAAMEGTSPQVVIIIEMRPERVFGRNAKKSQQEPKPAGFDRVYRACSWYFASDFLTALRDLRARTARRSGCGRCRSWPPMPWKRRPSAIRAGLPARSTQPSAS